MMYVYVFVTSRACKVGMSRSPEQRLASLQAATFETIRIAKTFEVREDRALAIEQAAIRSLAAKYWRRGEWFKASEKQCCRAVTEAIERDAAPPVQRTSIRVLVGDIRKDAEINRLYRMSTGLDKGGPGPSGKARRLRERETLGILDEDRT